MNLHCRVLIPGDFSGLSEASPSMVCGKRAIKSGQVLQNRGTQTQFEIKKHVARLLVLLGPTSHFATAQRQQTDTIETLGTEILGRIFIVNVLAPRRRGCAKNLPRDFL